MTSLPILLLCALFALALADLPAIHEKEITVKVKAGGPLSIKIPAPTTIWHRKFKGGRAAQYVETCNPHLDVCEKWRSGTLGKDVDPVKVSLAQDGTLNMPKVVAADSAQYYTYYMAKDGVHHYSYFNVIAAVRGAIDCQTANGRRPVAGITMRFMEYDLLDPNDVVNSTITTSAGTYYMEGAEDEIGKTIFFAEAWFPCSGPVFDRCSSGGYHAKCDSLKPRKNCHYVIELLLVPTDKYYTNDADKVIVDAGRFMMDTDKKSKTYMKCD